MAPWYDQTQMLACTLPQVKAETDDLSAWFVATTRHMPGLSTVDLVEAGADTVVIRTNEGVMTRTHVHADVSADTVVLRYDEEYVAGSKMTATSRVRDTFTATEAGVSHRLVIEDVEASGVLGFFYRHLGSGNIGDALMEAQRAHLSGSPTP